MADFVTIIGEVSGAHPRSAGDRLARPGQRLPRPRRVTHTWISRFHPDHDVQAELLVRVQQAIAAGRYDTPDEIQAVIDQVIQDWERSRACDPFV